MKKVLVRVFFVAVVFFTIGSLMSLNAVIEPGVSNVYNIVGPLIAPNMITVILFDFRGFDTLGECLVLVTGVLVTALIFGRGGLNPEPEEEHKDGEDVKPTPILDYFTPLVILLIMALGVYVALGGHITPGGGFQGGSLIAAGVLIGLAVYGRRTLIEFSHGLLIHLETLGVLLYILLGLFGLIYGGFFLYNLGVNLYDAAPTGAAALFDYPDITHAGIIPYLNIAVLLKVSAGLSTVFIVLLGVRK